MSVVKTARKIFSFIMASPLLVRIWMRSVGTLVKTNKKKTTASTMTMTSIRTIVLTFNILLNRRRCNYKNMFVNSVKLETNRSKKEVICIILAKNINSVKPAHAKARLLLL